jgi:hypothetical protein
VDTYAVRGRTVSLPVEVRRAAAWSATYTVPRDRAQALVPAGLEVAALGKRALLTLAFVRYDDSDLDAYEELAVSIAVRAHDAKPAGALRKAGEVARGGVRAYIRHLPVNEDFTLEAGRSIWGYPKWLAGISIVDDGRRAWCMLTEDGRRVLALGVRDGGSFKLPRRSTPTYSDANGDLNLTSWELTGDARGRIGGAILRLGEGRIADELRALGLPKRALLSTSTPNVRARFGAPQKIS